MNSSQNDLPDIISRKQLAELFKMTSRNISHLAEQGLAVPAEKHGMYKFKESVQNICTYYREGKETAGMSKDAKQTMAEAKLTEMQLKNDERQFEKDKREKVWAHRDDYEQAYRTKTLKLKRIVTDFFEKCINSNPNLKPSEAEDGKKQLAEFFNEIADADISSK